MSLKINGEEPKNIYLGNDIYDYDLYVRYVKVNGKHVWSRPLALIGVSNAYINQSNVGVYDDGSYDFLEPGDIICIDDYEEIYTYLQVNNKHYYFDRSDSLDSTYENNKHSIFEWSENVYGAYNALYYQEPLLKTYVEKTSGYSQCKPTVVSTQPTLCEYGSLAKPSISGDYSMYGDTQKCYDINFYNATRADVTCTAKIYKRFSSSSSWSLDKTLTFSISGYSTVNKTGYYSYGSLATQLKIIASFSDQNGCYYDSAETTVTLGSLDEVMDSSTTG